MYKYQRDRNLGFFAMLSLPATAMGIALSVQISALSWLLSTKYGLDVHEIGLVWAAGPIAGIIGQILIGVLSDKLWFWGGRRSGFIILGSILASCSILLLPHLDIVVDTIGFASIIGVSASVALILDLAVNVGLNPTRAIVADLTENGAERSKGFIWMQTMSGIFSVGAYGVGAIFGNIFLIYVGGAVVILFGILPTLTLEEPKEIETTEAEKSDESTLSFITALYPLYPILIYDIIALSEKILGITRQSLTLEWGCGILTIVVIAIALFKRGSGEKTVFSKIVGAHALSWVGIQSLFIYLVSFIQDRMPAMTDEAVGQNAALAFLVLNALGALTPLAILAPATKYFRRVYVHAFALALLAFAFFMIWATVTTMSGLIIFMVLAGIGWGSIVSLPFAIFTERVNSARMGLYMGLFNLSVVLPQLIASFGIGTVLYSADDKGLFFLIGAISIGLSAVAWLFVNQVKPTNISDT